MIARILSLLALWGMSAIALFAGNPPLLPSTDSLGKAPFDYVNPFIGTAGNGHTYPGATLPFGMVQLSPDTELPDYQQAYNWCAGYRYEDPTIIGFSHTHLSGTGHGDLGDVLLMPTTGRLQLNAGTREDSKGGYRSRFTHKNEAAMPGYYRVQLDDYNIQAELTATTRAGFHRYTFPKSSQAHIILDLTKNIFNYDDKVIWSELSVINDTLLSGYLMTRGWARSRALYFSIALSKPMESWGFLKKDKSTYGYAQSDRPIMNGVKISGRKLVCFANFTTTKAETILVKVGISGVSQAGALNNLLTEIPTWDFDAIRQQAKSCWEAELNKVRIEGDPNQKSIFYTAMYHALLAPNTYMDVDGQYRGIDQNIHRAKGFTHYSTFSLWDTYRAQNPLLTLLQPQKTADIISSMLAHYQQSVHHKLPVWSFHGNETWCMTGHHAVSVIADAYLKGITNFDTTLAWQAMQKTMNNDTHGRLGFYLEKGYVPSDQIREAASKTQEYAYNDWCMAQMAGALGREQEQNTYRERALNYKKLFDKKSGFMRARQVNGHFRTPFDPMMSCYGGDYTEGSAWQYLWNVPHDIHGLMQLMGGKQRFTSRLDSLFNTHLDDFHRLLMKDNTGHIGQYAHGNEPSHHIAYLYNYAGKAWKTQERLNQIMTSQYQNHPNGLAGNEDCGQLSAWYIFTSLGFYPVCPGSPAYVIGRPFVEQAEMQTASQAMFSITTENFSDANPYIQAVFLNGIPLERSYIYQHEINQGGQLHFIMGPRPNKKWANRQENTPASGHSPAIHHPAITNTQQEQDPHL